MMEDSQPCGACSDSTLIGEVAEGCGCSSEEGEAPGGRCAESGCGGESSMADTDTSPISTLEDVDTVYAAWTSNTFLPCTDWVPGGGVNFIRVRWELLDRTGNLRLAPGFQVANRENAPGAFNNIGSQQTADGFYEINWTDVRSYTDDKQLIRLGWVTRNTSGTALSLGRVRCVYELLLACGSVVRPHFGFAHGLHAGVKEKVEGDLGGFNDRSVRMAVGWGTAVGRGDTRMLSSEGMDWSTLVGAFVGGNEAGAPRIMEDVWTDVAGFAKGPQGTVDPVPEDIREQLDCAWAEPPFIEMPDFASVHAATQICFILEYDARGWPETDCCDVSLQEVTDCFPPEYSDYMVWVRKTRILNFENEFRTRAHPPKQGSRNWIDPSKGDLSLYFSALTLIAQNFDIVRWAACHVETWSPEIKGSSEISPLGLQDALAELLFNYGRSPQLAVMFVDIADAAKPQGGPTAWAIVSGDENKERNLPVTLVIPLNHVLWQELRADYAVGGVTALCAVARLAQILLHEMVHVVGDNYDEDGVNKWTGYGESSPWSGKSYPHVEPYGYPGTLHDDNVLNDLPDAVHRIYEHLFVNTCWDEPRMVASMFVWGIHHRYSCLPAPSSLPFGMRSPCDYMVDPSVFANSILGGG